MRIAIVNDLALAREVLRRLVESVPGYTVAWMAVDGAQAVTKAATDPPDVILMDLVMPVLDGVDATRQIMAATPCPILVVTSSLGANYGRVYEALGAGGLDALRTPTFGGPDGKILGGDVLLARLAKLASGRYYRGTTIESPVRAPTSAVAEAPSLLAIGASTGGPAAVAEILMAIPRGSPMAIVIVQHIAAEFAVGFADWLQSRTGHPTRLAQAGVAPARGQVDVAGRDDHLIIATNGRFAYVAEPTACPYRPSVDVFFQSLALTRQWSGVAVLLTGMGSDGARGLALLRKVGWHTIAQNQETCVVYGMPKAAAELGAAVDVLPLSQIGPQVIRRFAPS